jgi:hypothetical protein
MSRKLGVDTDEMPDMTPEGLRHTNPGAREISRHVHSYESASKFLGGKKRKKLANNTWIQYAGVEMAPLHQRPIAVQLHNTYIVEYDSNKRIIRLNSGGYQTVTTKQRINQLLPYKYGVTQKNHRWYVVYPDGEAVRFHDFMEIEVEPEYQEHDAFSTGDWSKSRYLSPLAKDDPKRRMNPGRASNPPRGQGKFRNDLEEVLYYLTLEGADGEYGEVDGYGYHASLLANVGGADLRRAVNELGQDPASALHDLHGDGVTVPINAIVGVDSQGFVDVSYFDSEQEARVVFEQGENDYSDWLGETGYDGN